MLLVDPHRFAQTDQGLSILLFGKEIRLIVLLLALFLRHEGHYAFLLLREFSLKLCVGVLELIPLIYQLVDSFLELLVLSFDHFLFSFVSPLEVVYTEAGSRLFGNLLGHFKNYYRLNISPHDSPIHSYNTNSKTAISFTS